MGEIINFVKVSYTCRPNHAHACFAKEDSLMKVTALLRGDRVFLIESARRKTPSKTISFRRH